MSVKDIKVFVIEIALKDNSKSAKAKLDEALSLTKAIDLKVLDSLIISLRSIQSSTYIGRGNIEKLKQTFKDLSIGLVFMDCNLSPIQQRNLERIWNVKVIDRTALILEIFGERARTKEGVLQVEYAHLTYQRSRLVRSWTHLERQRGGAGFLGGPGETQIEMDRRIIDEKLVRIKKELEQVKKTRALQRKNRKRVPFPIVSLVGYTNAGKSTIFNKLTKSDVFAKDLLFATLDPTMRILILPSGKKVILSDTVGFISDLPTELIAAFRATLEEVVESDLILHVRDISHPDTTDQKEDVEKVLKGLHLKEKIDLGLPEILNKIDLLDSDDKNALSRVSSYKNLIWPVSAKTGEGLQELLQFIDATLSKKDHIHTINLPFSNGKLLSWLYEKKAVVSCLDKKDFLQLTLSINDKDWAQILSKLDETELKLQEN